MKDGRGKGGLVILSGMKLFRCPGVGERLVIEFRVAEHFLEACVVQGVVDEGVKCVLRREGEGDVPNGGGERGHGLAG